MLSFIPKMERSTHAWRFFSQCLLQLPVKLRLAKYHPANSWYLTIKSTDQLQDYILCFQKHFGEENTTGIAHSQESFLSTSSQNWAPHHFLAVSSLLCSYITSSKNGKKRRDCKTLTFKMSDQFSSTSC